MTRASSRPAVDDCRFDSRRLNSTVMRLFFLTALLALLAITGCGFFTGPKDVRLADPKGAVADARKLIAEEREKPNKPLRPPDELPLSLRFPGLRWAVIESDHIDLVMYHDPDVTSGARIWSIDTKREHKDEPTRYPDVYFFDYNNDAPKSPDNLP
jgi:hypothetical protein